MTSIVSASNITEEEEAFYRTELQGDYAPLDPPSPYDESTIGFDFSRYPTLHRMALSDARIKICIGPAGCLPSDTEVLTPNGWVSIDKAPSIIMCYDKETNTSNFHEVEPVSYPCPEGFHRFYNSYTVDMAVSDEHKIWYHTGDDHRAGKNKWKVVTGLELANQFLSGSRRSMAIPTVINYKGGIEYPLTDVELRISVMVAADGTLPKKSNKVYVSVNREYKKERIRALLTEAGISWKENTFKGRPSTIRFSFTPPERTKDLTRFYVCNQRQLKVIADESLIWDGYISATKGSKFSTSDVKTADFMQFAYIATGTPSKISKTEYVGERSHWSPTYTVTYAAKKQSDWATLNCARYEHIEAPDGKKYCFHTPTGLFVARRNGKVFVTGNSAKTSGIIWQIITKAIEQTPASDGVRYSRCVVARNTAAMLRSTTINSFKTMVGNLMSFRTGSFPMMGHLRCDLSDGTKVHLDVEFLSFDTIESQNKLLGCEPTFAFVDEVSELPESLILAINRRLGRYPNGRFGRATWVGLLGATNGPLKNHWLYKWSLGKTEEDKTLTKVYEEDMPDGTVVSRTYFELFRQPPALLRQPDGTWRKNVWAENIENLPSGYGYYINMLNDPEQKIKAYVEGDFADLVTGKVVYPEFNEARHVVHKFNLPYTAPIYLSFDFGRTPVCLLATATSGGRVVIFDEVMGEDMSIETLVQEHIRPLLRSKYPNHLIEFATGDPSGLVSTQAVELSPFDVLVNNGIPIESPGSNKIGPRLEATKQKLTKLDRMGEPMLQITDNCKFLIEALKYNYIYESVRGKNDMVRDTPTKTHEGWASDLCDALGYLCMYHNAISRVRFIERNRSTRRARFI